LYICTAGRFGRYGEKNAGDTKPATDAHNSTKDETTVTTDKLHELINEMEYLTSNQKQKLTAELMKYEVNLTKKSGKCKGFEYTFQSARSIAKVYLFMLLTIYIATSC